MIRVGERKLFGMKAEMRHCLPNKGPSIIDTILGLKNPGEKLSDFSRVEN